MFQSHLLKEIAPPLHSGNRPLPVSVLHDMLCTQTLVPKRLSTSVCRALTLCAVHYRFSELLLSETRPHSFELPSARRWLSRVKPASTKVDSLSLVFQPEDQAAFCPPRLAQRYVETLDEALVGQLLDWAPPVVLDSNRAGEHMVIANHITAVIARYRFNGQLIRIRRLERSTSLRRSVVDMCRLIQHAYKPIYNSNKITIAKKATSLSQAMQLTGKRRAWCAQQRQSK